MAHAVNLSILEEISWRQSLNSWPKATQPGSGRARTQIAIPSSSAHAQHASAVGTGSKFVDQIIY